MKEFLINLCKYFLLSFILLLCWAVYKAIIVPCLFKRKHRKYKNVYVSDKFIPFLGDLCNSLEDVKQGKVYYNNIIKKARELDNIDLKVSIEGMNPELKLVSAQAVKEFFDLVKVLKVDRQKKDKVLGYLIPNSTNQLQTTPEFIKKKKFFLNLFKQSNASKWIPDLLAVCDQVSQTWSCSDSESINMSDEINHITFNFIFKMVFGTEWYKMVDENYELMDYINQNNELERIPFRKFLDNLVRDSLFSSFNPLSTFVPILRDWALINPFKRDRKNLEVFKKKLSEVMQKCMEKDTLYGKGVNMFDDIFGLVFAAAGSPANAILSSLYFLKKNPKVETKLREHLKSAGIDASSNFNDPELYKTAQEVDYLNYVIKEVLRVDCPFVDSFEYETQEDVTICGVPIPKGIAFVVGLTSLHHSPTEWVRPEEFIPERFDLESEYFYKPSKSETVNKKSRRDPYSYIPFGIGMRNCVGQGLAWMVIRTGLLHLLLKFDIQIDEELLKNEDIGFAFGSNIQLKGRMKI